MVSLGAGESVRYLELLETVWDLEAPLMVQVRTLRLELRFLAAFFCFQGMMQIDVENLRVRLDRIRAVVQDADKDLQSAWPADTSSNEDWRMPANFDRLISGAIKRIEFIKPDLQEVYSIVSNSSPSFTTLTIDGDIMELMNSVVEIMEDVFRFEVDSIAPVWKEMEAVEVNLRFLRDFFGFNASWAHKNPNINNLRTHVAVLAQNMTCLLCLCFGSPKMDDPTVHDMKSKLLCQLQNVKPIQPRVGKIYIEALRDTLLLGRQHISGIGKFTIGFLNSLLRSMKELSETKLFSSMIPVKDGILALEEELRFFTQFEIDPSLEEESELDREINDLLRRIISLICETGCFIYSFYCNQISENMTKRLSCAVSDLLTKVKAAKEDTRKIYLPMTLLSNFPRTNEMGFVSSLLQNLKEILEFEDDSRTHLMPHIEEVQQGLLSIQKHFSITAKHPIKYEDLKDQLTHFKDMAYLAEYIIDSFVIGDYPLWCYKMGLSYVIEEIKSAEQSLKVFSIQKKSTVDTSVHEISSPPSQVPPMQPDASKINTVLSFEYVAAVKKQRTAEVVVFEDEAEEIKEKLTNGLPALHILSIVGMPGIGKTTLADSIFENPSIACWFHVRAKCCVSKVYQKMRLFREILQQVNGETEGYTEMSEEDLDQKVYQSLKGKRYLIMLDDIWDITSWNELQSSFPDDDKESRIIFTSRFHSIASQVGSKCITYPLYPLSDEKTWEMLQIKLFQIASCPGQLVEIGQQIAKKCNGLPLAVDLVAGILRMREQKKSCWQQVAKSLTTELLDNPDGRCKHMLEFSYHDLPDHLKPCFLYFGAFPEDSEIPQKKLMWMWIAEGFVQLENAAQGSLEYVAETYLTDLISRSLITISKRTSLGGVKASRVHDLLGEFARAKAKEDSFFWQMDRSTIYCHRLYEAYRLSIHGCPNFWRLNPSGPRVRSLLLHDNRLGTFPCEDVLDKLRLLRVLDMTTLRIRIIPSLDPLVHLRFVALSGDDEYVIVKIVRLRNLQTFLLSTFMNGSLFAEELWLMESLRHFRSPATLNLELRAGPRMVNLQTLSTLRLRYNDKTVELLGRFPNLEKLKCEFFHPRSRTKKGIYFPRLDRVLSHLKSLNMSNTCNFKAPSPCEFCFPASLKKLTLSKFGWPWPEISIIGKLEYLEVLKLGDSAFTGEFWSMMDGEFPKLKFLSLSELDIEEWNAYEDHLPCLERLKVHHCWKLEELPSCLANIATLKSIEMKGCKPSAGMSAKSIKDEQKDLGNDEFVANIY